MKSKTEYDRYQVVVSNVLEPSDSPIDFSNIVAIPTGFNSVFHGGNFLIATNTPPRRRFTYRTRFEATLEQNERIQELLSTSNNQTGQSESEYFRLTPVEWRRYVYERKLYALPLPDSTGRFRECTAEFYRSNNAQTHRLIPWLNRELVVLIPPNNTNVIPQILEEIRDLLISHDIISREMRVYFRRHLHGKTNHFIHEFHNFAISPFDIVGYDRNVDYNSANTQAVTIEIPSGSSGDEDDVQLVDLDDSENGSSSSIGRGNRGNTTEVVLETSSSQEQNCILSSIPGGSTTQETHRVQDELMVETSSDSECQFVLALKPPHLRTPEQITLNSASDSDVVYIPNQPQTISQIDSSSTDSDENKPLSETQKILKSEKSADGIGASNSQSTTQAIKMPDGIDMPKPNEDAYCVNYGASTSNSADGSKNTTNTRKLYFKPVRKRLSQKSIFDSTSSSTTSEASGSDNEWQIKFNSTQDKLGLKRKRALKNRRKISAKELKKRRASSTIVRPPKSLHELPTSEEARSPSEDTEDHPKIKSVIIKKCDDQEQHYIEKSSESSITSE